MRKIITLSIFTILTLFVIAIFDYYRVPVPRGIEWVKSYELKGGNAEMVKLLDSINSYHEIALKEQLNPKGVKAFLKKYHRNNRKTINECRMLICLGDIELAINKLNEIKTTTEEQEKIEVLELLALCYLRKGELDNCVASHNAYSCIFPIKKEAEYTIQQNTKKSIKLYEKLLGFKPNDWRYKWLLNVANQTIGNYPNGIPNEWLIQSSIMEDKDSLDNFFNAAPMLGLNEVSLAGGAITDDFNNDGLLDIMVSGWKRSQLKLYINQGKKGFYDATQKSKLTGLIGGFNLYQLDYNNDGNLDVFVVRGAWLGPFGLLPNSLLKNNGDGTFTDVTVKSGVLSFKASMVAVCADFNHDGYTDIYVGNDSHPERGSDFPSELLINNGDGTFKEESRLAGVQISGVIKGLSAADYDNDGKTDLFVSQRRGENFLFKNVGNSKNGVPQFIDVSKEAEVKNLHTSFTSWFWDYNNDGFQDLYVSQYNAGQGLCAEDAAKWYSGIVDSTFNPGFYHNNGDGTFTNIADEIGLNIPLQTMGANFGDINNDGWLDFYLGTGEPNYMGIAPNRLFESDSGLFFNDVTIQKGVGHIQKGHGIAFGDIDNDGDQDILAEMGGISDGDPFQNALFVNPENGNKWISIHFQGVNSTRDAIGTKIKLVLRSENTTRFIYRTVSSGGSFGGNSLRQEIGLGGVDVIDSLIIDWTGSLDTQVFTNVETNNYYNVKETVDTLQQLLFQKINYNSTKSATCH